MINNPNMLKETLENFNKVPEEVIKETIKEVLMNDKEAKIILEDIKNTYKYCYKNNNAKQISINVDYKIAEAIEIVLNLIERQKAEIEKKDKVIDNLVDNLRYYNGMQQDDIFCNQICSNKENCDRENCYYRIKEYFENKVKESK